MKKIDEEISPEWDQIKNFVGATDQRIEHPLEQEVKRIQPQTMADGGIVEDVPQGTFPPPAPPSIGPVPPLADPTYQNKASDILGGISPQSVAQLAEKINQNSRKSQIGAGIAGIGDAIASVGGENPGHMRNAQELIQKNQDRAMQLPGLMAGAGKQRFGLAQELQASDPASPFSKVTQNANRQLLKSMGATDADIRKMAAATINDVVGHQVTLQEALARIQADASFRNASLDVQREGIEIQKKAQEANERNKAEDTQMRAAEGLGKRSIVQRAVDAIHPSEATKMFQQQLNGSGPLGAETVKDGKVYIWSPSTGKYHLKQ